MLSASGDNTVPEEETLTEDYILRASRQYDVELVYSVELSCKGLSSFGDAFARCQWLARLDVSRNNIVTLKGIAFLAGSLQHLNAAENKLTELIEIESCLLLEDLLLECNRLNSEDAIAPLAELPRLRRLVLQRTVSLDAPGEMLLLENPLCSDKDSYEHIIRRRFGNVLSVDGRCFRDPPAGNVVEAATIQLPSCDMLKSSFRSDIDDVDERIFSNAVAECRVACQRALRT